MLDLAIISYDLRMTIHKWNNHKIISVIVLFSYFAWIQSIYESLKCFNTHLLPLLLFFVFFVSDRSSEKYKLCYTVTDYVQFVLKSSSFYYNFLQVGNADFVKCVKNWRWITDGKSTNCFQFIIVFFFLQILQICVEFNKN